MIRVTGKDIDRVAGLQDWNCRINESEHHIPETANVVRDIVINMIWMVTQNRR